MESTESNFNDAVAKLEDQLKGWDAKIDELSAKVTVPGQEVEPEGSAHLEELKSKLAAARAKLEEAKAAGSDKWDSFKEGLEGSWKDLEEAFQAKMP